MARDDDAEGVAPGRGARGARAARIAGAPGELGVSDGLAEAHLGDFTPDRALERRALRTERQREATARAGEVFFQLALRPGERARIALPLALEPGVVLLADETHAADSALARREQHAAARGFDVVVAEHLFLLE